MQVHCAFLMSWPAALGQPRSARSARASRAPNVESTRSSGHSSGRNMELSWIPIVVAQVMSAKLRGRPPGAAVPQVGKGCAKLSLSRGVPPR